MKKITILAAVVLMFASCGKNNGNTESTAFATDSTGNFVGKMPIGIVNVDTLLANYTFAKESNEALLKKQEDARLNMNTKVRQLQNEMVDFQRKLENNAFLSRDRAENESRRLQNKEAELQELERKLSADLMQQQQAVSQQLRDSIDAVIKLVNKDNKYHLIISTSSMSDNVLFAADGYDITNDVLEVLNSRHKKK